MAAVQILSLSLAAVTHLTGPALTAGVQAMQRQPVCTAWAAKRSTGAPDSRFQMRMSPSAKYPFHLGLNDTKNEQRTCGTTTDHLMLITREMSGTSENFGVLHVDTCWRQLRIVFSNAQGPELRRPLQNSL
jgi:hypothetical protein